VRAVDARKSPLAIAALCCGIASIVICFIGFIIGPVAIGLAIVARNEIARRAELVGSELATAGLYTGIAGTLISLILGFIGMMAQTP
jgi:hypothetical protein